LRQLALSISAFVTVALKRLDGISLLIDLGPKRC
jgi:hypothetical protein